MILLSARDLARQFDAEPVFRGVSFDVRPGERIGLVGPNGSGKTTLLNVLAGRDEPDVGRVETHPMAAVALLEQENAFAPDRTLFDEVKSGLDHLYDLQEQAHALADQMAAATDPQTQERLHRRYDDLHLELERLDAYHVDHRVEEVLHGLGFAEDDYQRPLATFSGGQQNRAILGRLLLRAPDVMLLDEPTNHLDIAATEWLEDFLARSQQAMLVVSHDRYFLDKVTTRTLEIFRGGVHDYAGNFSAYWRQRDERHKVLRRTWEKQQEFIAKTEDFIRRNAYGQKHAQAKDREKKLERLERVELPPEFDEPPFGFPEPSRTGDWVLRAEDLAKSFGGNSPLFENVTLQVDRGERIGIFGPNGSGKTTLLRCLIGELQPTAGEVRTGTGVEFGYFDQQLSIVDPNAAAVEAVRPERDPHVTPGQLRSLLARFGIRGDLTLQQVGAMSGGEKTRTALARLAALRPNVMVLDEPTNHLDFWSAAALERSLREFNGTVLFVSHDRYFLDQVATKVLVLEQERHRVYEGNYSDYLHHLRTAAAETGDRSPAKPQAENRRGPDGERSQADSRGTSGRRRRFPYRRVDEIEAEIAAVEERIAELEAAMADADVLRDGERARQVRTEYDELQPRLTELLEHWEEAVELN